jgi:hypothetical protein
MTTTIARFLVLWGTPHARPRRSPRAGTWMARD